MKAMVNPALHPTHRSSATSRARDCFRVYADVAATSGGTRDAGGTDD
jgi:hypothetical protein